MSLVGKKIWIDIEEPKTGIMFKSLFKMFMNEGAELLITARDFDSTFKVMDDIGIKYEKVGRHGGGTLEGKLSAYIERLNLLSSMVIKFKPDFFVTFSSVEGPRISFGLQIPSIGINDEPRNEPVCKLIFPFLDEIITPACVPIEEYIKLYAKQEKIIRYNGIDEVGWLSEYVPNPDILKKLNVEKGKFVLIRSEMSSASYLMDKMRPEETMINQFFPKIFEQFPDYKYFLSVRSVEQERWLKEKLKQYTTNKNVEITRYLPNMVDLCYYAALVISGGGTIVRESSLLGVPSIEYFPGVTAPQEIFLMNNGFPIEHIKEPQIISKRAIEILKQCPSKDRFSNKFKDQITKLDNPNQILFKRVKTRLLSKIK
jgi:predicted glycosyltransferase